MAANVASSGVPRFQDSRPRHCVSIAPLVFYFAAYIFEIRLLKIKPDPKWSLRRCRKYRELPCCEIRAVVYPICLA